MYKQRQWKNGKITKIFEANRIFASRFHCYFFLMSAFVQARFCQTNEIDPMAHIAFELVAKLEEFAVHFWANRFLFN